MIFRDWQFWAALAAAPLFLAVASLFVSPQLDPGWMVRAPGTFVMLVVVYPVLEEIVFRGLLQGWLLQRLPGKRLGPVSVANLLTSAAFMAPHFLFIHPLWALGVFAPSLVFGHFRERHRTLVTPIVLHVWYNLGYFWLFAI